MTYGVTRLIDFCYGHRLMDYAGKCRFPHGHNGRLEIDIEKKALDSLGMVVDFELIKQKVQTWVDSELDHKMLLNRRDPLVKALKGLGHPVVLMDANPTAEAIAKLVYEYAKKQKLPVKQVRLWETPKSYASYSE